MFLKSEEKDEPSKDVKEMISAVKNVEANLKQYLKDEAYLQSNMTLHNIGEAIAGWREQKVFTYTSIVHKGTIENVLKKLDDVTGSTSSSTSFRTNLSTVRSKYVYGESNRLILLLGLLSMYAECMLLECVLLSNLSNAYDGADPPQPLAAQQARSDRYNKLLEMRIFLDKQREETTKWIAEKKKQRKDSIVTWWVEDVKVAPNGDKSIKLYNTPVKYTKDHKYVPGNGFGNAGSAQECWHLCQWKDDFSDRTWNAYVHEWNTSGHDYGRDVDEQMRRNKVWQAWYSEQLDQNIAAQFKPVEDAMVAWTTFCKKMEAWTEKHVNKTFTRPIDAKSFYENLCKTVPQGGEK